MLSEKIKLLFLCTGNSCRSQMAEGWVRHLKGDQIDVWSAGIETHGLNKNAVQAMSEAGVDISGHQSQLLDEFKGVDFDYVITVCGHAHETCPWFPGNSIVVHKGFDDPPKMADGLTDPDAVMDCYRKVRDEIRDYVISLPESLESIDNNS